MNKYLDKREDEAFHAKLLRDIPYFHHLYSKYHDPDTLELVRGIAELQTKLKARLTTHEYQSLAK